MLVPVPALPTATNCTKISFLHTIGSETNTGWHLFFRADKPASQTQMQAVVDAASTTWAAQLAQITPVDVTLTSVTGTDLSDPAGAFASNVTSHVGTRAGGFLPASACVLYNMQIQRRYRGGKPRAYLPAGAQPDLSNPQTWAAAFLNTVNGVMANLITAIQNSIKTYSATADLVNISYYHSVLITSPPSPPVYQQQLRTVPQVDVVVARAAASTVGSQRRRLRPG